MNPKVSIIIPIYGVEKYIERCVDSLLQQSLDSIEFIFIDDCTLDSSIEILKEKISEYSSLIEEKLWSIRIEKMPVNSGLPAVRKYGIQLAKGEFVLHCDSDDWVDTAMCKELYEKAIQDNSDMVICDYYVSDGIEKTRKKSCFNIEKSIFIKELLTEKVNWSAWNKLVRRSLYSEGEIAYPQYYMGEDMALMMQLVLKAERISYIPKPLYYYYLNQQSYSHLPSTEAVYKNYGYLLNNTNIVLNTFENAGLNRIYKKELLYIKWLVRKWIWKITCDTKYRDVWKTTFPDIFPSILVSPYLRFGDKVRIVLTYLHLYPKQYIEE